MLIVMRIENSHPSKIDRLHHTHTWWSVWSPMTDTGSHITLRIHLIHSMFDTLSLLLYACYLNVCSHTYLGPDSWWKWWVLPLSGRPLPQGGSRWSACMSWRSSSPPTGQTRAATRTHRSGCLHREREWVLSVYPKSHTCINTTTVTEITE